MANSDELKKKVMSFNKMVFGLVKHFEKDTGCYVDFINVDHIDASEFDDDEPYILKDVKSHVVLDFNDTNIEQAQPDDGGE